MRFSLRTFMLLIFVACVIANYAPDCETWWWSRTRPAVTFAGNTFEDRDLAYVAGVPLFAELTMQEAREATVKITRAYRIMGYLRARIGIERSVTNRGWATCFVIDEGKHYSADEVSERFAKGAKRGNCVRHGPYLCVSPDGKSFATTSRPCPICDIDSFDSSQFK